MRQLISNYYALLLKVSNSKPVSYFISVLVVSVLVVVTIFGLSTLLQDMFPTKVLIKATSMPYGPFAVVGVFIINLLLLPPSKFVNRSVAPKPNYTKIILSIGISVVLFAYAFISSKMS